ncbi:MAG TPA: cytochrome P450 [Burkholderiaceae bacterium]|nr:cytochrome P450 [Burkholderiaceae bacterium]
MNAETEAAVVREIADLPGPRGLPVVGNLFQLHRPVIHQDIERWVRQYGELFRVRMGARELVVIADHEMLASILRDRPDRFRRSPRTQVIGQEMGLMPGVFGSEGDTWRRQRRMVMAGLDPTRVRGYFPTLLRVLQRLQKRWLKAARAGQPLELQPELMRFSVDAIAGLAFGSDVNTLESDGEIIQQHLDKIFPALYRRSFALIPYWRWIPLPADRALAASVVEVKRAIAGFIAQARARLDADPARRERPPNLLESMIVAAEAPDSGIDNLLVAGNVLAMLLAGEDTTANTLAWAMHLLHRHPAALRRAADEVCALGRPIDALTQEDLGRLDFVEACLHETMRLKPVAPFMVLQANEDVQVAGLRLPRDTLLWCVMRHHSVDGEYFPQPDAFLPERWLDERAAGPGKRISMPFGAGPRICPGRYLALTEMKMVIAMLLSTFDIEAVDAPGGGLAEERMSFTMVPVGLRMRLRARA